LRLTTIGVLAAALALAACATRPSVPAATADCPALTVERWSLGLHQALQETFGATLKRRFGSIGTHLLVDPPVETDGVVVYTVRRIGPEKFEMPAPGKGGELEFALERCTAKVLKVRKLSDLEASPAPRAQDLPSSTSSEPNP
jgi:hypothetical protein